MPAEARSTSSRVTLSGRWPTLTKPSFLTPRNRKDSLNEVIYQQQGDFERRWPTLTKPSSLTPNAEDSLNRRDYQQQGDIEWALADFDQAIVLDPRTRRFAQTKEIYQQQGDYERALADFDQAIALDRQRVDYSCSGSDLSADGSTTWRWPISTAPSASREQPDFHCASRA